MLADELDYVVGDRTVTHTHSRWCTSSVEPWCSRRASPRAVRVTRTPCASSTRML